MSRPLGIFDFFDHLQTAISQQPTYKLSLFFHPSFAFTPYLHYITFFLHDALPIFPRNFQMSRPLGIFDFFDHLQTAISQQPTYRLALCLHTSFAFGRYLHYITYLGNFALCHFPRNFQRSRPLGIFDFFDHLQTAISQQPTYKLALFLHPSFAFGRYLHYITYLGNFALCHFPRNFQMSRPLGIFDFFDHLQTAISQQPTYKLALFLHPSFAFGRYLHYITYLGNFALCHFPLNFQMSRPLDIFYFPTRLSSDLSQQPTYKLALFLHPSFAFGRYLHY